MTGPTATVLPGGHSEWEPPDPFSNSEVKTLCADASVDFVDVKVGHCQALNLMNENPTGENWWGFFGLAAGCRIYGPMIWFSHMKTTLDMDDDLLRRAKRLAAAEGISLRKFVEDALRARMLPAPGARTPFKLALPVVEGRKPPAVDIADRDALYDLMGRE